MSIADNLQELISCKSDIKTAIEEKGVSVTGGLSTYADAVREISVEEWAPYDGIKFMYSTCTQIPKFSTKNIKSTKEMFFRCDFTHDPEQNPNFVGCPAIETGHITNMASMFQFCTNLVSIPNYDTSSCVNMSYMFDTCNSLLTLPLLEAGKCRDISWMMGNGYQLRHIGGLKDLGKVMWEQSGGQYVKLNTDDAFRFSRKITRESCLNIFNNLYDVRENPGGYIPELKFESEVIARLSEDDISIAVGRGWTISSY